MIYLYINIYTQESIIIFTFFLKLIVCLLNGSRGRDRMVVGFKTTYAISAYQHHRCTKGVLNTTLYDKVWNWLVAGRWFSLGTLISTINKTDHQDIIEILLKVTLNTINQKNLTSNNRFVFTRNLALTSNKTLLHTRTWHEKTSLSSIKP